MLLLLEARRGELYHPTDDEWAAIEEGLAQARRGEFRFGRGNGGDLEPLRRMKVRFAASAQRREWPRR